MGLILFFFCEDFVIYLLIIFYLWDKKGLSPNHPQIYCIERLQGSAATIFKNYIAFKSTPSGKPNLISKMSNQQSNKPNNESSLYYPENMIHKVPIKITKITMNIWINPEGFCLLFKACKQFIVPMNTTTANIEAHQFISTHQYSLVNYGWKK